MLKEEYEFVSLEEFVYEVINSFSKGSRNIDIVLTPQEVQKYLVAFLSTDKLNPASINWSCSDYNEYDREYYFSLFHFDDDELFVEPVYVNDKFMRADSESIILISDNVKVDTYARIKKDYDKVILFSIED